VRLLSDPARGRAFRRDRKLNANKAPGDGMVFAFSTFAFLNLKERR
jgi:hypothetical protein